MNEKDEDIVYDIKHAIWDIEDNIARLLQRLETEMERTEKEDNEDGEACFDLYIKAGFTIGTKFIYDNTEWTITGINPKGFVVTGTVNGEERKQRLPAYDKNRIEKCLNDNRFKIIEQGEVEE